MPVIERIREKIRTRDYYLSLHAAEELAEDGFERTDMENAVLTGFVQKRLTHDPRGTRYRIEGTAKDGRTMNVICRFSEIDALVVITVYARNE